MVNVRANIPEKIYYSISEVSQYTGVEPYVLRYWETKFSKLRPKRVGGTQRKYTRADLDLIFQIIELIQKEGYTLDGAERRLRGGQAALKEEIDLTPDGLQREVSLLKRDLQSILETLE